jgi:hypothetical protein
MPEWVAWAAISYDDREGERTIGLAQRCDGAKDMCQEYVNDLLGPWSEVSSENWSADVIGLDSRRYIVRRYALQAPASATT